MICKINKPTGILSDFVKCIWILQEASNAPQDCCISLIPSGCVELIFHFSDKASYEVNGSGKIISTDNCIAGQRTKHTNYNSNNSIGLLSVMLKPATANLVLGIPANDINNAVIKCEDIWSAEGLLITEQIADAKYSNDRFRIVEKFLIQKVRDSVKKIDKRILEYVRLVSHHGGNINIQTAADHLNISSRQLERKVLETIGATPKEFSKVIRFQKALAIKQVSKDLDLTSLAYKCGYYDQSHFIKDFKSITGLTPQCYFQSTEAYSDYYSL